MATPGMEEKTRYIRDVWHDNLETEMANIREIIVNYPIISMVRGYPTTRRTPAKDGGLPP